MILAQLVLRWTGLGHGGSSLEDLRTCDAAAGGTGARLGLLAEGGADVVLTLLGLAGTTTLELPFWHFIFRY